MWDLIPSQAVILAGGLGTRLRPITNTIPKPLIEFHGRPFLSFILDQIKQQGIEKVLLLVGYRGDQIKEYCRDGSQWGLEIKYSLSPIEADTGLRLKNAKSLVNSKFLLMYCDNYCPLDLGRMWEQYNNLGVMAQVTAYTNQDNYTRNNLRIASEGIVELYDPERSAPDLNGVDIGYAIFSSEVLDLIPDGNPNFERTVYPILVKRHQLAAYKTDHRYYSVSSHERLDLTKDFLEPRRAVLLDRDGVINVRPPRAHYVRSWEEFEWLPQSIDAIKLLNDHGYIVALISNQSGIGQGLMTEEDLHEIHNLMQADLNKVGAKIDAIFYCPHGWDDGCLCRKPLPGMLYQAQRMFNLDLSKTWFIGDDERDSEAGKAAGCLTELVSETKSLINVVSDLLGL